MIVIDKKRGRNIKLNTEDSINAFRVEFQWNRKSLYAETYEWFLKVLKLLNCPTKKCKMPAKNRILCTNNSCTSKEAK